MMIGVSTAIVTLACATGYYDAWSLADHMDRVLVYTSLTCEELTRSKDRWSGLYGGTFMRTVYAGKDGGLRPYSTGMAVKGELRRGQLLLAGARVLHGTCAELVVSGGTHLTLEYGLCDGAVAKGNEGSRLEVELHAGGGVERCTILIDKNQWQRRRLDLPKPGPVLVRLISYRLNAVSTNWTGLVVRGDGRLGSADDARRLSPSRERLRQQDLTLEPSPHRVTAKPGYDILFYRGKPFLSYAGKGHGTASHAQQAAVAINTFYVEGMSFGRTWAEGAEGVVVPPGHPTCFNLKLCQQFDMPFKAAMSLAHCTPFLPPWLVAKEKLGFEQHQMRREKPYHASIFKAKTLHYYKQGLRGWTEPLARQPSVFVFSQEDRSEDLDDYSAEAVAGWRAWLARRFANDFGAFKRYVGGASKASSFADAPYPQRIEPHPDVGYPMRLAYLKQIWVHEAYGDFLADVYAFMRKLRPGVPLTQRYTNSPFGVYLSKRVKADYNYTFGHLTTEGWPNAYAIGRKCWTGIYTHAGALPLPRGGSIGKTYSRDVRRGPMTEAEWRLNAYTAVANGICGFEYSPVFPTWGPRWTPAALFDKAFKVNEQGKLSKKVMGELLSYSKHMMHYEHHPDVAVFHDGPFNSRSLGSPLWSQSKGGIYALVRECGFHPDVLTCWDMTAESLRGRKVLVLAGSLSIAPEIQDAIRQYVREGGTLVTVFCADAAGLPGANSYAYKAAPRESAAVASFDKPKAVAHLGDVLGVREASGVVARQSVRAGRRGVISLAAFNALVDEKKWVDKPPCCATLAPTADAKVLATFDDGSPAAIEHAFGKGRAITFAFDLGLIANSLTVDPIYAWWSELLASLGCRKAVDTRNWRVEGGAWRDDSGNRVVFLVNHDTEHPQKAALPDGRVIKLAPAGTRAIVMDSH